jgi:hypothetical protein
MGLFEVELSSRGGAPLFKPHHILKSLWVLAGSDAMGRKDLAARLGIGEGTARKLLSYIEERGWAISSKKGISLTIEGKKTLKGTGLRAGSLDAGELTVGEKDFCVCLSGQADKIRLGIEQRDEAIMVGAKGATTLVVKSKKISLPDGFDVEIKMPEICKKIKNTFRLKNGDVVIIGTAKTEELAEDGAFAGAVYLLKNRKD